MQDISFIPRIGSRTAFTSNTEISLPAGIFNNNDLSALETISKYLKENMGMKYREIARILNRDERTIWDAYNSSREKMSGQFQACSGTEIPLRVISDRKLGALEAITSYLKDVMGMRYCAIARLLNRDDRTIWTSYQRSRKKRASC